MPGAWVGAPVVHVAPLLGGGPDAIGNVVDALAARAVQRERTVFVLDGFDAPMTVDRRHLHLVGPAFTFLEERLHHLVWSNSVDLRDPARPSWGLMDAALRAGALATPPDAAAGDVTLPDGTVVWLDGGPPAVVDAGSPVLHRIAIEHGLLAALDGAARPTADLAPDQLAAVAHTGAAARIVAPAGSGKTRVLTERARHLLRGTRWPASAVSLVAFNVRAQREMADRTPDLPGLQIRTLNAIALAIVNGSGPFARQPEQRRTIDERDVRRIIDSLVEFPRRRNTDPVAPWIEALAAARLGLRDPAEVERSFGGDVTGFAAVFPRYREALARAGEVDFDEQIYRAIKILMTDPGARATAQRACRILLVDEFQDLTPAHLLLVRLLASPDLAVFGVGDDDQTIYGYNGADPSWLIDFGRLFPGSGDHPLEVNYRCPPDVVHGADRLLRHNRRRVAKTIRPANPNGADGYRVIDNGGLTDTLDAVGSALNAGRAPRDIAVLARVNALLAPVQVGLVVRGVAVNGGVGREFTERTAVRAALAWLRLAGGAWLNEDLAEALRRPSRPVHPNVAEWVLETNRLGELERLAARLRTPRDAERIGAFHDDIGALRDLVSRGRTTAWVLDTLFHRIGLAGSVAALDATRHGTNRGAQDDDLTALAQLATLQPDPAAFPTWLAARFEDADAQRDTDGVTLATVHRVKGQEWPVVVVHEAAAGQFPHRLAENHEEERRVFHVAITRASEQLTIVAGEDASPFVAELTTEPPARTPGATADDDEVDARRPARRPSSRSGTTAPGAQAGASSLSDRTSVIVVPGLVLSDHGTEWTVTGVTATEAVARSGPASRRFDLGSKATTAGGRTGVLRAWASTDPDENCVRADDLLRRMRRLAAQGKPAYTVFDDATIERIALARPASLAELAVINGIGPVKLERYGDAVLLAVEDALSGPTAESADPS